jgi:hypothetical protein
MARRLWSNSMDLALIVTITSLLASNAVALDLGKPPSVSPPSRPDVQQPPQLESTPKPEPIDPRIRPVPMLGPGFRPVVMPAPGFEFTRPNTKARTFSFKIDPNTPIKDLLPTTPQVKKVDGPFLTDDLTEVPEVEFQARAQKGISEQEQAEKVAHQLAKINHVNSKKTDSFMMALLAEREDLAGIPFVMGDDCRMSAERTRQFTEAVERIRFIVQMNMSRTGKTPTIDSEFFWEFLKTRQNAAQIAALMQILAPESVELRLGLIKYLAGIPNVEATKALARMAIFSQEVEVRNAACDSLKVRPGKDYTDILIKALRYPWPAVAKRSSEAIARMGRSDLLSDLVAVLDQDDPRMPASRTVEGKQVVLVREMVKVNHHRNCMMCHAPAESKALRSGINAEVPLEGQPLPPPSLGYQQSLSDLVVRIDVTYLRQDFSSMLPVKDASPWPEMQRFDFFVRERKLTFEEANDYKKKLTLKEEGVLSPYHEASLAALRQLTGKDTAPTAEAWRKLLDLPTPQ